MKYRALNKSDQLPIDIQHPIYGMVAENEQGEIVGLCGFIPIIHLDPLWIHPNYRKHPTMLRRLWTAVQDKLKEQEVPVTLGFAREGDSLISRISEWAGGREVPGRLYAFKKKE